METSEIYDDINSGDLGEKIVKLESRNRSLILHVKKLSGDIEKLCNELTSMKKTESNLKTNISELYKSSKLEIERKDRQIFELQQKLDDYILKSRSGFATSSAVKRIKSESTDEHPHKQEDSKEFQRHQGSKSRSNSPMQGGRYHDVPTRYKRSRSKSRGPPRRYHSSTSTKEETYIRQRGRHSPITLSKQDYIKDRSRKSTPNNDYSTLKNNNDNKGYSDSNSKRTEQTSCKETISNKTTAHSADVRSSSSVHSDNSGKENRDIYFDKSKKEITISISNDKLESKQPPKLDSKNIEEKGDVSSIPSLHSENDRKKSQKDENNSVTIKKEDSVQKQCNEGTNNCVGVKEVKSEYPSTKPMTPNVIISNAKNASAMTEVTVPKRRRCVIQLN